MIDQLSKEELAAAFKLGKQINALLPEKPQNIGIPIVALKLAQAIYLEYLRSNITEGIDAFETLLRQTDILIDRMVADGAEMMKKGGLI